MSLDHLELLIALRTTGNLGRAAELVSISPSAASHRLREAERRLGLQLTVAHGRTVKLTPAALHLAEVGADARALLRSAEETARWMSATERQPVRIALDFYDTAPWFEPLTARTDLTAGIDFVRVRHNGVAAGVHEGHVDIGVSVVGADEHVGTPLLDDDLQAIVREDHPAVRRGALHPTDVADATYVTAGDRPEPGFEHHTFFEPAGVRPHRLRKVESLSMILRLLRAYGGVTIQPSAVLSPGLLDGLAVVPLAGVTIPVRWELVVAPGARTAVRETAQVIRRLVTET